MATPPGGGEEVPQAGYYPDPSIPGYIRFWNGAAWVPGTSRPAPKDGEAAPRPPASAIPAGPILASGTAPAPVSVQSVAEPVRPAASAPPAQVQAPAHVPAQAQAPAPVPTVEETGPVFFDEEPAAAEPASAWQADTSRQTGFGGERDQRVSWGSPRTPDPRTPADWPVAGANEPTEVREPAPERAADPRTAGGAARLGGMPVTPMPTPAPAPAQRQPEPTPQAPRAPEPPQTPQSSQAPQAPRTPQTPQTPQAPQALRPQPAAPQPAAPEPATAAPAPTPVQQAPVQRTPAQQPPVQQSPTPAPVPQAQVPAPAPAAPSWAQQPQPQEQQQQQPVVPWKPPVDDLFVQAARAQASARPAGLGRRLLARLVDTLVLGALVGAAAFPFVTAALDHIDGKIEAAKQSGATVQVWLVDGTTSVQFGIALAAFLVIGVLYEVLPVAKWGRTLGKRLCGIEVRDIEAHQPPRFGAALRRWLVYGVLGLLAIGVLNVLWCLFDRPWRQCWHDKAARTFVAR
ncbi:RDD family protein [Streptomyces venezuelae]|uniref:RDD family protein n=1 Tax=Streptomyces venezuelae TaxID=54571 RepID=UPI0037D09EDA